MRQENTERIALDLLQPHISKLHLDLTPATSKSQVPPVEESMKSGRAGEGIVSVQRP